MTYHVATIEQLKRDQRFDAHVAAARGSVKDLQRSEVVVHQGRALGSISGWAGGISWQVWVDHDQQPGHVHARIDRGEKLQWSFNATDSRDALLDAARDRAIAEAQARRETLLADARAQLNALEAASA